MASEDLKQIARNIDRLKDDSRTVGLMRDIRQELINIGGDLYYFGELSDPTLTGKLIRYIEAWLKDHEPNELQA